jgi:D-serine deaminase-like pyridoxal phosphate-dependent protein
MVNRAHEWARIDAATAHLDAPLAAVDLAALASNADSLVSRAGGLPIRLATKSIRCRAILDWALRRGGFRGLMAYSLDEAIWLVAGGFTDVLVAYPTVSRSGLARLAADLRLLESITLMVDDDAHLGLIREAAKAPQSPIRVCIDVDSSLRIGPLHLGARRSPLHEVHEVVRFASRVESEDSLHLVGLMFYDAQIAGVPDSSAVVRLMKRRSIAELTARRRAIVRGVGEHADLSFVNGGGTGSLHTLGAGSALTEVAAGSGLYGPTLFDGYDGFRPLPALAYALPVTRGPAPGVRTLFAGGYVASGPSGPSRLPAPIWPSGLRTIRREGVGEVQTPVHGRHAGRLQVGDRVWWRHAKAGEVCEHFTALHLVGWDADGRAHIESVPTYRGEGECFG